MKNNVIDLLTYTGAYWKGKLYCLARDCNLLFAVDLQNGETELVDVIPEQDTLTSFICGIMSVWNDKLIFTPNKEKKIWIYDLVSRQWDSLPIKDHDHIFGTSVFYQIHLYNTKMFLVGGGFPAIVCLDLENNSIEYIDNPYKDILTRHPNPDYLYFWYFGVKSDNKLYFASCLDNYVLILNMDTLEYDWIKVGDNDNTYLGMTYDGNNFWLSPRLGDNIIKWDGKKEIVNIPLPSELKKHPEYLWGACYDGKQIILPATNHQNTILINIENDSLKIQNQQYTMFSQLDNGMIVSQTTDGNLSVQNGDSVHTYKLTVDTDQLNEFYKKKNLPVFKGQNLYYEGAKNSISSLESFLALTKSASEHKPATEGQIGKTIWEAIR